MCAGCHFWSHKNPILFAEFIKEYLGEEQYEQLKIRARSIKQWSLDEMIDYYEKMKSAVKDRGFK
jgi:hypothetical protein